MTVTRHNTSSPPIDAEEVFRFLGYDPRDPAARAVVGLCVRYELDPFAGHIIVIPGRRSPYVTRDGHLWLAHRSGQFDGMETLEEWATDKNAYAKVAVWRKDMSHPFVYTGRCPLKNPRGGWDENADKKAVANAEVRALKRAFPLQLPSIVDYEDDLDQVSGVEVAGEREPGTLGRGTHTSTPAPSTSETTRGGVGGASSAGHPTGQPSAAATPGPPSPSAPEQEEAAQLARSRAEGANQDSKTGVSVENPPTSADATTPPEAATPPAASGGTNRPASSGAKGARPPNSARGRQTTREESHGAAAGRAPTSDEEEQALFEQGLAADDPRRHTR